VNVQNVQTVSTATRWRLRLRRLLTTYPPELVRQYFVKRHLARRFPRTRLNPRSVIPPGRISIGEGTYGRPHVRLFRDTDTLIIGRYCSIGPATLFLAGGEHDSTRTCLYPFRSQEVGEDRDGLSKGPIVLANDVWIGAEATVLSGVTIGNSAIVGARSVVSRDVPSYGVAVGNPARVIRRRFADEVCDALDEIAWWDWPSETIRERIADFYLPVEAFVAKHHAQDR